MEQRDVMNMLEMSIPTDNDRSHYYSFHVRMRKTIGMPHPFVKILSTVLAEIDKACNGYAKVMVEKIASYKGMGDDKYEQLIQTLAEIHVLYKIVSIADIVNGKPIFEYEPQKGGRKNIRKNPECRSTTKGISYCAEVKSPRLLHHQRARQKGVQLTARWPYDIPVEEGVATVAPRDNPIKQALEGAQAKFEEYVQHYPEEDYRLLFLVWDDFIYEPITALLHTSAGLFTPNSFNRENGAPVTFPLVDGVVIVRQLHQFQQFLADRPCVNGVLHPFQFDCPLPNAFVQNPNGRDVPKQILDSFNCIIPGEDAVASEYKVQDLVDWTLSDGGGMGYTGLDQLPEGIDREEVLKKLQELHQEIREKKRKDDWK